MVFRHGDFVIKVPLNEEGLHDNWRERSVWLRYGKTRGYIKYARCRLWGPLLVMEYAKYPGPGTEEDGYLPLKNCPEWAYAVDCWQVGYNKSGEIVAYDYGF